MINQATIKAGVEAAKKGIPMAGQKLADFFSKEGIKQAGNVAKETAKAIDVILEDSPNPEKKKKILEKKKLKQDKAKEFYCSKVKDKEKCGNE